MATINRARSLRLNVHVERRDVTIALNGSRSTQDLSHDYVDIISWNDTRTGIDNPYHAQQIARHTSAGTPLSGSRYAASVRPATIRIRRTKVPITGIDARTLESTVLITGVIPGLADGVIPLATTSTAPTVSQAVTRFYQSAWSGIRSLQGGVFLGELTEALRMIKKPGKALREGIDDYARLAKKRARSAMSTNGVFSNTASSRKRGSAAAAGTWLEANFGWRPLISDIKSGAEAIAKLAHYPFDFAKVSAQASNDYPSPLGTVVKLQDSLIGGIGFATVEITQQYKTVISCRIRGEVGVEVTHPVTMAKDLLGFSWENFVPTVWELIPYSFLVDYFTNIGDIISAWSFPDSRLRWHNRSVVRAHARLAEGKVLQYPPNSATTWNASSSGLIATSERREVWRDQDPLKESIRFLLEIPGSSTKWLNIASLATLRLL